MHHRNKFIQIGLMITLIACVSSHVGAQPWQPGVSVDPAPPVFSGPALLQNVSPQSVQTPQSSPFGAYHTADSAAPGSTPATTATGSATANTTWTPPIPVPSSASSPAPDDSASPASASPASHDNANTNTPDTTDQLKLLNRPLGQKKVRIGVFFRRSFDMAMKEWQPTLDYLSSRIPQSHFVVTPLASEKDIHDALENETIDFLVVNPALVVQSDLHYGTSCLASMITGGASGPSYQTSGVVIRRANDNRLNSVKDIRNKTVAGVKSCSFTGWYAEAELLKRWGINPDGDLKQTIFADTPENVVTTVLSEQADVGFIGLDQLQSLMRRGGPVDQHSLFYLNRTGKFVPYDPDSVEGSTGWYPNWAILSAPETSHQLAQQVTAALMDFPVQNDAGQQETERLGQCIGWTVPDNYARVRQCMTDLYGPSLVPGAKVAIWEQPVRARNLVLVLATVSLFALVLVLFQFLRIRRWRDRYQFESTRYTDTQNELNEVRAEKHHFEKLLAKSHTGIDVVDHNFNMRYSDSGTALKYGNCNGKTCYEYYLGINEPCENCSMPLSKMHEGQMPQEGIYEWADDEGYTLRGVTYRDDKGEWLCARIRRLEDDYIHLNDENSAADRNHLDHEDLRQPSQTPQSRQLQKPSLQPQHTEPQPFSETMPACQAVVTDDQPDFQWMSSFDTGEGFGQLDELDWLSDNLETLR